MTIITVNYPKARLSIEQRRVLATTLTDAVMEPEVGRISPEKRRGYQVHYVERDLDMIAHSGALLCDKPSDVMVIDVAVMDCCWTREVRETVFKNIYAALAAACGMDAPSPTWWINFRVIEEGNWGSRGGTLSFLQILDLTGPSFPQERAAAIRTALAIKYDR